MSLKPDFHIRPLILQRPDEVIGIRLKLPVHQRRRDLKEISDGIEGLCAARLRDMCGNYFSKMSDWNGCI
ncbi:hypothetical protein PDR5_37810 [Pseudomonas sp. DR 5-09]|nr:hypothetical protein PDR5_37810 [Pseudomonas sp. DR 5-09]